MKTSLLLGVLVLLILALDFGAGYELRARQDHRALVKADSLAEIAVSGQWAAARRLDASRAAFLAATRATSAEQARHVRSAQDSAARLGVAAASLLDSIALALDSLPVVEDAWHRLQAAFAAHLQADAVAADSVADVLRTDSVAIARLAAQAQVLAHQRDYALIMERQSISRAIRAEAGWSRERRFVTALACVAAGVGAAKSNAPVGLTGSAVCLGSFVLR